MEQDLSGILDRCREPGGDYRSFDRTNLSGIVRSEWLTAGNDPEALIARADAPDVRICKDRPKVRAVLADGLFIKRYHHIGFWNSFRKLFKVPRPERVLGAAVQLRIYEIPTPEVLAALRLKRRGLPVADYLITRELSPFQLDCGKLAPELAAGDPYRQFVSGLTALLVKMHGAGVEHGDLNLRNIFCRRSPIGIYSDWGLIDLDGSEIYSDEVPESRRRRELARVISSFLRAVRHAKSPVALDADAVTADFTRKYKELSGFNLAGSTLDARIGYLTGRVRKDRK